MSAKLFVKMNNLSELFKNMQHLGSQGVLVGIPAEYTKREDGKITNAEIGYINEFGSPKQHIPPRPFLNPALANATPELAKLMVPDVNNPNSTAHLDKTGLYATAQVKKHITNQIGFVPLNPKTIRARQRKRKSGKAGTKALYDTGNLLQSIHYIKDEGNG